LGWSRTADALPSVGRVQLGRLRPGSATEWDLVQRYDEGLSSTTSAAELQILLPVSNQGRAPQHRIAVIKFRIPIVARKDIRAAGRGLWVRNQ